ncbi:MAG: pantoate--beta-alanine ligase [Ekhidna sp.]
MHVIGALDALSDTISTFVKNGETIGFVPTMGALHDGHLALVRKSVVQNQITVVSIFVNPLQFNNAGDLEKYPRVIEQDVKLLDGEGVDVVFIPSEKEMYASKPIVSINFGSLTTRLEGEFRSGHFEGVGIVVSKLLHLVNPSRAYFGLKDLQQFILIQRMCSDLGFPCDIIGVETVREISGLALSSRNKRLTDAGKIDATIISEGLRRIKEGIEQGLELTSLLNEVKAFYNESERFKLEYLEAVNPSDLSKITSYDSIDELAVCVAGYVEGVRLIDNLYLQLK